MKYYSDVTDKVYTTEQELVDAELAFAKAQAEKEEAAKKAKEAEEAKKAQRKQRADEIETARKEMVEAQKKYQQLINDFVRDYHSYHFSATEYDNLPTLFTSIFDLFDR